jgi:flagellar motility protein MotE (MotC chaperone)
VPQLRLLPVTIVVAAAMLMVRVNDIWSVVDPSGMPHLSLNQSEAQQPPPPGGKKKKGDPQPAQPVAPTPAPTANTVAAPNGSTQAAAGGAGSTGDANAPAAVPGAPSADGEPPVFTQNEVDVLEKLSARRQALDSREHDIEMHEDLLKAAEDRIDKKIAEMKALQTDVKGILQKIDEEDDAKLKSLVKVYETMNPKDAARIFEQLDMPVLLGVVSNMKEQKIAAVMGVMDAAKAKTLTDALAARRATKIEGQAALAGNGTVEPPPALPNDQSAAAGGTPPAPAAAPAAAPQNPPGG